jgi:hypothetical protein
MCVLAVAIALLALAPFASEGGLRSFLDMTVVTQVGRPGADVQGGDMTDLSARLLHMLQVGPLGPIWQGLPPFAVFPLIGVWTGLASWSFFRGGRDGRFWSVTWLASLVLLLSAPSYYDNYPVPMGVAAAMLLGAGAAHAAAALRLDRRRLNVIIAFVAMTLLLPATYEVRGRLLRPPNDLGATIRETIPLDKCAYVDPPSLALAAGRLPFSEERNPLIDPFGEPVYIALHQGVQYATARDALYSDAGQDRVRAAIEACPYVALRGPAFLQPRISPATALWLSARYGLVVDPKSEDQVYVWRR